MIEGLKLTMTGDELRKRSGTDRRGRLRRRRADQARGRPAALREYIARRRQARIARLFGTLDFDPKYDYKKLRRRP